MLLDIYMYLQSKGGNGTNYEINNIFSNIKI